MPTTVLAVKPTNKRYEGSVFLRVPLFKGLPDDQDELDARGPVSVQVPSEGDDQEAPPLLYVQKGSAQIVLDLDGVGLVE